MTGTDEHLHASSNLPGWCMPLGLDSTQQGLIERATTASRVHRPRPRQTPRDGPDSVLEPASSGRRTLTFSTSCFLTALISSISRGKRTESVVTSLVDSRASHSAQPARRRLPKLAARRSAVLRARHAACRAPCPANKAPPESGRFEAAAHQWHGCPLAAPGPGSPPQQQAQGPPRRISMPHLPAATNGGRRAQVGARVRRPTRRPRPRPRPRAGRRGPRLLRAKPRTSPESSLRSPCGGNTRGSQRHGRANVEANPPHQCRAHVYATRFGRRRLRFARLEWIGCSQ
jgi:hypothetical protein